MTTTTATMRIANITDPLGQQGSDDPLRHRLAGRVPRRSDRRIERRIQNRAEGSSRINTLALAANALAIETCCCSAMDKVPTAAA